MRREDLKSIIMDCIAEINSEQKSLDEEERDYAEEYRNYHSKPEQKKNRAKRNNARRRMEREGRVSKGDGNDVDHKNPLRSGGSNGNNNLRIVSKSKNRANNGS